MVAFNPWSSVPLLAALLTALTGLWVFFRGPRNPAHRPFLAFCLLGAAGNAAFTLSLLEPDPAGFVAWNKAGWAFYAGAAGAFCHFTYVFPRPRRPLEAGSHPWASRIPGPFLRLDRWVVKAPGLPLLLSYLPALALLGLFQMDNSAWLEEVHPVFLGHVAVARVTFASLPAVAAGAVGFVFLGVNILAGCLAYPDKRRVARWLLGWFVLGFGLLTLLFVMPRISLELYAAQILLHYAGMAGFALFLAVAVGRYGFLVTPVDEARGPGEPRFELMRGATYLAAEERPDLCHRAFADLVTHGTQGLCLTRTPPRRIRETHGLEKTPVVWVGEQSPSVDVPAVYGPDELAYLTAKFLSESRDGVVALDCLEYLVQTTDFRRALKLVYHLKEMAARKGGRLLLSVNPRSLEPREWSLLEKETEPLPEERPRRP